MKIDSIIANYYLHENKVIFPPENICLLLKRFLKKDNDDKRIGIQGGVVTTANKYKSISHNKDKDFLTVLNTLSHSNFEINQKKFDCFQETWTKENTTTFISFIVKQQLHSNLYAKIIVNYKPGIICTFIERLFNITEDFKENVTIGIYFFNIIFVFVNNVVVCETVYRGILKYLEFHKKNEELVLQFIIELIKKRKKFLNLGNREKEFILEMKNIIYKYFECNSNLNIKTKMLYLDYCDEIEFF
jgi:hypothetical protein